MVGRLELIFGNMSSGKSEYMRNKVKMRVVEGYSVQLVTPADSLRESDPVHINVRGGYLINIETVNDESEILSIIRKDSEVIGLDEIIFYDEHILEIMKALVNTGKEVFACIQDPTFRAEPIRFGEYSSYDIIPYADSTKFLSSICTHKEDSKVCGNPEARWIQKYYGKDVASYNSPLVETGDVKPCDGVWYAPRCREHFVFYD